MIKFTKLSAALALALAVPAAANASLLFDPDGAGPLGTYEVDQLDWNPTSVLAVNGNAAIQNFLAGSGDTTFTVLTHVKLGSGKLNNTTQFDLDTSAPGTEITGIISFQERVTAAVAGLGIAQFSFIGSGDGSYDATKNFVKIFYDSSADANQLTGVGFGDGTVILDSTVTSAKGTFTSDPTSSVNLDQNGADNWAGQQTVTGIGSNADINVDLPPISVDAAFFKNLPLLKFNASPISLIDPFTVVDPSKAFYSAPGAPTVLPVLGAINGSLDPTIGGKDFIFSTDYASSVNAAVPEPTSLALLGLGMGAAGLAGVRRRRKA